jgi:predicted MPP superfamily phosphohydrolase
LRVLIKYLPEFVGMAIVVVCHWLLWLRVGKGSALRALGLGLSALVGIVGLAFEIQWVWKRVEMTEAVRWARGCAIAWGMCSCGTAFMGWLAGSFRRPVDPSRRKLLQAAQGAMVAAPAMVMGYGVFISRRDIRPVEVSVGIQGLPKDLDGLRIAQVSDIHYGIYLDRQALAGAVRMANEFRPHLTVVTGDLITGAHDSLDDCLSELAQLRADAGIYGCLGNHEIYAQCEEYATEEAARRGIWFLRGKNSELRFGQARLNLAGVDYQKMHGDYLPDGKRLQQSGAFNLLLSHNPDAFRVAAPQAWDLMLAGHTHGGQVTVEYLHQHVNFARFFTPYVYGHYQEGKSHLFVTRGIGTVGVPARIGAPPEVALIKLCAT